MKTLTLKPFFALTKEDQNKIAVKVIATCRQFYLDGNSVDVSRRKTELQEKVSRKVVDECIRGTELFKEFSDRNSFSKRLRHASFTSVLELYESIK